MGLGISDQLVQAADSVDRVFEFCRSPHRFLLDLALSEGPVARFRIGGECFASLSDPELIHAVLAGSMDDFERGSLADIPRTTFGDGIFTVDGPAWVARQADLAPFFSRPRLGRLAGTTADLVGEQLERWNGLTNGDSIDMLTATRRLAFDVVRIGLLGISNPALSDALFDALNACARIEAVRLHYLAKRIPGIGGPFQKTAHLDRLDRVLREIVDEKLAAADGPGEPLTDMIGASLQNPSFQGLALEEQRKFLRDLIASMMTAGYLSTGESMFWALYLLARHPEAQTRAQAEIRSGIAASGAGDWSFTAGLPYLSAVLNESLRLYPPVWFVGRVARRPVRLGGLEIPEGTALICSPFILHRMPQLWPDPEDFRPDRFLAGATPAPRAFIPFGAGSRACLGRSLAMMTMSALVGATLSRFEVSVASAAPVSLAAAFTMHPRERIFFRLRRC